MKKIFITFLALAILLPSIALAYTPVRVPAVRIAPPKINVPVRLPQVHNTNPIPRLPAVAPIAPQNNIANNFNSSGTSWNPFSGNFFIWYWLFFRNNNDKKDVPNKTASSSFSPIK